MTTASLSSGPGWRARRLLMAGALVAAVVATILIARVVSQPSHAQPAQVEHLTPWLEDQLIHYPQSFATREKLAFVAANERVLTPSIYVTGSITYDARRVAAIGARIEGRLRTLSKVEGEDVKAGEVVAELESVELGQTQAEVLKVRAREQVAKLDAERERKLADAKISAERDAQFAQANADALTAERMAAEKAVEALGGAIVGEVGILKLRSPFAGRVVELKRRRGETVSPTDTILVIADLRTVWVEFVVYERDISSVREGDLVELHLPSDRAQTYSGTIVHVSEIIDPEHRTGHVRVELDNADGRLRPGSSVIGMVHASGPRHAQLTVPRSSVTRIDGKPTVFVRRGANAVEPREVTVGLEDSTDIAVLEGLTAGDEVVNTGVLALKAEVFR